MDEGLRSAASLLGRLGPWGSFERGELTLAKGVVTFTREGSGPDPLFSAPVEKVRVRFPRLYFGLGLQLTVEGRRHRVWFVSLRAAVGDTTMDGSTIVVGNKFYVEGIGRARNTTRMWRSALAEAGM
jgi:hypothetical protein